jgi:adenylate cyclase
VRSSLRASQSDPRDLLLSREQGEDFQENLAENADKKNGRPKISFDVPSLERTNKVLFVLYEISRQLSSIQDFNGLLKKIMDLIFLVIDADYGFLFLKREESNDSLIPVVVKYRDDHIAKGGRAKASRTIIQKVIRDKVALLTSNAMADSRLEHAESLVLQKITSAICVPLWMNRKIIGVIQLDSIRTDNQFTKDDLELLEAIGSQMAMVIEQASLNEQIRAEERMRNRLERFHPPQLIDLILGGGSEAKDDVMEPRDLDTTILFLDIVGFTPLAEQLPPREINMILNQYFTRMSDIIFAHDGMLDKYMGDGLMAVFGAPMEKEDDPQRAIRAALEMRKQLEEMMAREGADRKFKVRIGINTGRVVAGNIGSPKRLDYTVIGDAVNIASRLESIAQPNQIVIGEETYRRVKGEFKIKKIGPRRVKGKSTEVMVYEVL